MPESFHLRRCKASTSGGGTREEGNAGGESVSPHGALSASLGALAPARRLQCLTAPSLRCQARRPQELAASRPARVAYKGTRATAPEQGDAGRDPRGPLTTPHLGRDCREPGAHWRAGDEWPSDPAPSAELEGRWQLCVRGGEGQGPLRPKKSEGQRLGG